MVQFLPIIFFSWISSIFVGFFKSSRFFVSLCILVSSTDTPSGRRLDERHVKTAGHPTNSTHVSVRFVCVCVGGGGWVYSDNKVMRIAVPLVDIQK